jgi:hypothetical protein
MRDFNATHIDANCEDVSGFHENELFFNCMFKKLNGLTLKNCDLNRSQFNPEEVRDALGFTVTLDCHSFADVKLNPLAFDLILCLLIKSAGNDTKRRKLVDVIGKDRLLALLKEMSTLEGN